MRKDESLGEKIVVGHSRRSMVMVVMVVCLPRRRRSHVKSEAEEFKDAAILHNSILLPLGPVAALVSVSGVRGGGG